MTWRSLGLYLGLDLSLCDMKWGVKMTLEVLCRMHGIGIQGQIVLMWSLVLNVDVFHRAFIRSCM